MTRRSTAEAAAWQLSLKRRALQAAATALFVLAPSLHAQAKPDSLLNHLVGTWVLRGTLAGKPVVHDVTAKWVLGNEYIELREASRDKAPNGTPQYEAILYFVRDTTTHEILVLWLDNTSPSTFAPLGRGVAVGDSIPFVWTMSPTDRIHNTFVYKGTTDTWDWRIDNEDAKGTRPFARVTLARH